jgi:uncharacterized damage-inducible protein DinB
VADDAWATSINAHREAVARFTQAAAKIEDRAWSARTSAQNWSPGQVAEHIAVTYGLLVAELSGRQGMRKHLPYWKQVVIRWRFLPAILRGGRFPKTRAPREIRPPEEPRTKAIVIEALQADARSFEDGLSRARAEGRGSLTHPYFGRLRAEKMLGLITAHTEHHRRQLRSD